MNSSSPRDINGVPARDINGVPSRDISGVPSRDININGVPTRDINGVSSREMNGHPHASPREPLPLPVGGGSQPELPPRDGPTSPRDNVTPREAAPPPPPPAKDLAIPVEKAGGGEVAGEGMAQFLKKALRIEGPQLVQKTVTIR